MYAEQAERLSEVLYARLNERRTNISEKKAEELTNLIHEILDDVRLGRRKLNDLRDEAAHFEKLLELDELERNGQVVRLSQYREQKFPLERKEATPPTEHIQFLSGAQEKNWRRAIDFHHDSGRFAFVSYADVSAEVWLKPSAVKELGEMTIYIPEFSTLTLDQKMRLQLVWEALKQETDWPYFIVATSATGDHGGTSAMKEILSP